MCTSFVECDIIKKKLGINLVYSGNIMFKIEIPGIINHWLIKKVIYYNRLLDISVTKQDNVVSYKTVFFKENYMKFISV